MTSRRWSMVKLESGDYLLPSNDRRTLWRIHRYTEDGSLELEDGTCIKGTFWAVSKLNQPRLLLDADAEGRVVGIRDPEGFLEWENWYICESLLPTRAAAVEAALKRG